jgi:hypothetical protein
MYSTPYLNYNLTVEKSSKEKSMLADAHVTQGQPLFSYVIASGNMRHIGINEREIYLRDDPQLGPILQGEVPQCGPDCYANLSQILLEYTMSCEDCRDHAVTAKHVDQFGQRLGEQLIVNFYDVVPVIPDIDRLSETMDIILKSMGVSFEKELTVDHLRYELDQCPIHTVANKSGSNLWVAPAHRAFVALCSCVVRTLAPEWALVQPSEPDTDVPLKNILIARN